MRNYERVELIKPVEIKDGPDGPHDYMGLPRFYLASNIYVGEFGQVGLVVVDRKVGYVLGGVKDIVGFTSPIIPAFFRDALLTSKEHIVRANRMISGEFRSTGRRGFFNQIDTMAALRIYALPKELADVFMQNRYLGPALIRKTCEEDLPVEPLDKDLRIPELFVRKSTPENLQWLLRHNYEVPVFTEYEDGEPKSRLTEYGRIEGEVRKITFGLREFLDDLIKPLEGRGIDDYFPVGYVTYFRSSGTLIIYRSVTSTLEPLAAEVVQRFDDLWRGLEFGRLPVFSPSPRQLPPG